MTVVQTQTPSRCLSVKFPERWTRFSAAVSTLICSHLLAGFSPFLNVSLFQEELREFFGEFGPIHQLNILRDKSTGVSRCENN